MLLPFVDEKRLLEAIEELGPVLSPDEEVSPYLAYAIGRPHVGPTKIAVEPIVA